MDATGMVGTWAAAVAAAVLVAVLYEVNPKIGGPFLVLVVLVMLTRLAARGYLGKGA